MSGPPPKPAHLRQRTNRKPGSGTIEAPIGRVTVPDIPNPDARRWHSLTLAAWEHAWHSPMAGQWLETDKDALGRLAVLWDEFYREPNSQKMAEIRLQESRFGLSPLDRSRLQWEVARGEDAEKKRTPRAGKQSTGDPRKVLRMAAAG